MITTEPLMLTGETLSICDIVSVSRRNKSVAISPESMNKVELSAEMVMDLAKGGVTAYGITTGFGNFASVAISPEERTTLQRNLLRSHAVGVGQPYATDVTRAMMLLRANALAKGYSGIQPATLGLLIGLLNCGVTPVVPSKGSLGASGDLAPLAHMALVLIGEGEAYFGGERLPGSAALCGAGLQPVELCAKEGLALTNGTQAMAALGALAVHDSLFLLKAADLIGALSAEGLRGILDAYDPRIANVRPHPGQIQSAENLRRVLADSDFVTRQGELRTQDAYSLRCIPQVHGASRDAWQYTKHVLEIEINAATDNPLLFPADGNILSGGNFHGQPLALSLDFLGIAMAEIANISERRTERMLNSTLSDLPSFLIERGGLNSGLMILQYTAAALVSENKVLAHPASVDSIPTSANQEDHVSMGNISARKSREILWNVSRVLAIELICAAQAVDLCKEQHANKLGNAIRLGIGTEVLYREVRKHVPFLTEDAHMADSIEHIADLIMNGEILAEVEAVMGPID